MTILYAKVRLNKIGLEFELGDQKLIALTVALGAQSRSSSLTFTVLDSDLSIADKVFSWSRKNGGIKIPAELRQTAVAAPSTTGSTVPTGNNTGGTTDGARLEGLENEIVEVSVFMDVISKCEGTYPDGYNIMFTGATFSDFSDHPRQIQGGGGLSSDAAGRYQFLSTTWDSVAGSLGLTDFSPKSQNLGGWQLAKNRGVTADAIPGDPIGQLKVCNQEWASLPGSPYGQPTYSEAECQAFYDEYLALRKAKEGTTTPATQPVAGGGEAFVYSTFTPTIKAYLDLIGQCIGTYELGQDGYKNDPQNTSPLTTLDTYPGYESGRYLINQSAYDAYFRSLENIEEGNQPAFDSMINKLNQMIPGMNMQAVTPRGYVDEQLPVPNPEPSEGDRDFKEDTQDNIARWLLQSPEFTGEGTFDLLSEGNIAATNANASRYWRHLPGGTEARLTEEEAQKFFDERLQYWNENIDSITDGSGTGISAGEDTGEKVDLFIQTSSKRYRYRFSLVSTNLSNIDVAEMTFTCQAAKYALGIDPITENYENVTTPELIEIVAAKYNLPVSGIDSVQSREPIDRIDQMNESDQEMLDRETSENDVAVTEDPETGGLKVTDKKSRIRRSIIVDQIISVNFEDRGVSDEEPLYPVSIVAVTNDSLLSLYPEETVNLNNLYTFVPESLKKDDWVVNIISHNLADMTSNLELLKYIPIEVTAVAGGTVGAGKLTGQQIQEKYKNSCPKFGSASGYVITADGVVGTANHVIENATQVVFPDGSSYTAEVIDTEAMPGADLAICRIDATGLIPIPFAPDVEPLKGEDKYLCKLGYPGGQQQLDMKEGVTREISASGKDGIQGKEVIVAEDTPDFVNGGDSGCPWFDHWGLLVGHTTGGSNPSSQQAAGDYGYAPTINEIRRLCDKNSIAYTTGTRQAAIVPSEGSGTGSDGGGVGAVDGWVVPSKGVMTSDFGPRSAPTAGASSNHKGVDIAAGCGADIYAAAAGTVAVRNDDTDGSGYGNYLVIAHPTHNVSTLYGHNQENLVNVGDAVSAGQLIAKEGTTGTSTGCHLHFGVNQDATGKNIFSNTFVDPKDYIGSSFGTSYAYQTFGVENFTSICLNE